MHVALSWLHSQCLYQVVKAYYLRPHGTRCPPVAHDPSLSSRHAPSKTSLCVSAGEKNTRSPPLGQLTPAPPASAPSTYCFFTYVAKKCFIAYSLNSFWGWRTENWAGQKRYQIRIIVGFLGRKPTLMRVRCKFAPLHLHGKHLARPFVLGTSDGHDATRRVAVIDSTDRSPRNPVGPNRTF